MCGIIGVKINNPNQRKVKKRLYNIFKNQEKRGIEGAGFSILRNGEHIFRRFYNPKNMFKYIKKNIEFKQGDCVLLHHRVPTCSINKPEYNHPMVLEDGLVSVIHNGYLYNDDELEKDYKEQITTYNEAKTKFTDSELIRIIIEEHVKDLKEPYNVIAVRNAIKSLADKVTGRFAIAFTIKGDDKIWLFKNGNPIIVYNDSNGNHYFSSEFPESFGSFKGQANVLLADGELGAIDKEGYKVKQHLLSEDIKKMTTYTSKNTTSYYGGWSKYKHEHSSSYSRTFSDDDYEDWDKYFDESLYYDEYLMNLSERNIRKLNAMPEGGVILKEVFNMRHPLLAKAKIELLTPLYTMYNNSLISKDVWLKMGELITKTLERQFSKLVQENFLLFKQNSELRIMWECLNNSTKYLIEEQFGDDIDYEMFNEDYENISRVELQALNHQMEELKKQVFGITTKKQSQAIEKLFLPYISPTPNEDYLFNCDNDLVRTKEEVMACKKIESEGKEEYIETLSKYWNSGNYD